MKKIIYQGVLFLTISSCSIILPSNWLSHITSNIPQNPEHQKYLAGGAAAGIGALYAATKVHAGAQGAWSKLSNWWSPKPNYIDILKNITVNNDGSLKGDYHKYSGLKDALEHIKITPEETSGSGFERSIIDEPVKEEEASEEISEKTEGHEGFFTPTIEEINHPYLTDKKSLYNAILDKFNFSDDPDYIAQSKTRHGYGKTLIHQYQDLLVYRYLQAVTQDCILKKMFKINHLIRQITSRDSQSGWPWSQGPTNNELKQLQAEFASLNSLNNDLTELINTLYKQSER